MKRICEKHVTLYIGGVHASDEPIVIKTLLGSCVAVCLHDPVRRVGGMNHFLLPSGRAQGGEPDATWFGMHAMDRLITALMKAGGDRRQLVAKVFGGAHVLHDLADSPRSVARQNSAFAREFLLLENIPLKVWDVGGTSPREVHFHPHSGKAFVRRLHDDRVQERLRERELQKEAEPTAYGDITLFEQD